MEDEVKKILEYRAETFALAAEELVPSTLGTALASGRECDRASLLAWLDAAISDRPQPDLKRQRYEAARTRLLAASPSPSS